MSLTLYQRGATWWMDVNLRGRRVRKTCSTTDKRTARRRAEETMRDLERGVEAITVGEAVDLCHRVRWAGSAGEQVAMINARSAVTFFTSTLPLHEVTTERVDAYVQHLLEGGSAGSTVNRKLAALSAVLRVSMQRGHIKEVPHMSRQRESSGRIRWLSDVEEDRLLDLLHGEGRRLTIALLDTGMRLSEGLRFQAQDLAHNQRVVHIWQTKSGQPRTIPLTTRALSALADGPFKVTLHEYRYQWDQARKVMGFADDTQFVPHMLRHTCASRLVQRGVQIAVVKEWLGHASITTTMRYAHIAPANLEAAVAVLERN